MLHLIQGDSALNLHEQTLYVLDNDNHFDVLFSVGLELSSANSNPAAALYLNAGFIKPNMTEFEFDLEFNGVLEPKYDLKGFMPSFLKRGFENV